MKKTKKCLLSLLTVTAMFSSLALFASCDEEHEHNYESTVTKAATCMEDGVMTYTCTECDDTYTEVIPATGHSYTETAVEPTCTEQGYIEYVCSACSDSYKDNYTDVTGHVYENGVCTVCGFELNPSEGLVYTLSDDQQSYTVTGIGNCLDIDLVIPSTYNGLPVTSIGYGAFELCSSLTSIMIPDSVTSIGQWAFYCSGLTSIIIGNGVTSIGDNAFSVCSGLTSITIPESVTNIGDYAFSHCISLTSIIIPDSVTNIGDYAFYDCSSLTSITVSANNAYYQSTDGNLYSKDGKELIQYAIGKTATSFVIPNGVTSIGYGAFEFCSSLTSIMIPDSVTSIGQWAFDLCYNLTNVTIGNGVTSIGYGAFFYCSNLTSITIPNSVTNIGTYAFNGCSNLTSVIFEDTTTWYRTSSSFYINGTETDVSDPEKAAGYLRDTYTEYYWYKA